MTSSSMSFDLTADDYVAMNLHVSGGIRHLLKAALNRAILVGIGLYYFLLAAYGGASTAAFLTTTAAATVIFLCLPAWWHVRRKNYWKTYYSTAPYDKLCGPHALTLTPEGIESQGPHHRAFRSWAAIVAVTSDANYYYLHTIFGNIYLIPISAIGDLPGFRQFLESHLSSASFKQA